MSVAVIRISHNLFIVEIFKVHNIGDGKITVLSVGEDYVLTFPSAYGRSILTTPWVELGGSCKKTETLIIFLIIIFLSS